MTPGARPLAMLAMLAALGALAALAGHAPPASAQTLGLGRLFTTPEQRIALDMRRAASQSMAGGANPAPTPPSGQPAEPAPAAPAPEPVQLDGVVRRSGGKSTVWLNQVPHTDGAAQLRPDQSVKLRLSSGRALVLKLGQSFNPADGTIQETTGR